MRTADIDPTNKGFNHGPQQFDTISDSDGTSDCIWADASMITLTLASPESKSAESLLPIPKS